MLKSFMRKFIKNYSTIITFVSLLSLTFSLRILHIHSADFWRDEAFSIRVAEQTFRDVIEVIAKDTAPPLHTIILHAWLKLFGIGELSARLPSLIFGVLTVIPTYLIADKIFSKNIDKYIAMLLFILNPLLIWYSQEARAYSLLLLMGVTSLYFTLDIITSKNLRMRNGLGLFLSTVLGLYTHNLFLFIGLINLLLILNNFISLKNRGKIFENKNVIGKLLAIYMLAGMLYLPWFIILIQQLKVVAGQGFWLQFHPLLDIFIVIAFAFSGELYMPHFPVYMSFILITVWAVSVTLTFTSLLFRQKTKSLGTIMAWFWGLLILIWLYSFNTSFFYIRYLLFLVPAAIIIVTESLRRIRRKSKLVFTLLTSLLLISTLIIDIHHYLRAPTAKERMTNLISDLDYQENDIILHTNAFTHHSFNIYSEFPNQIYNPNNDLLYYEGLAVIKESDYYRQQEVKGYDRVWVIYLWSPKQHMTRVLEHNYNLRQKYDYNGHLHMELWTLDFNKA